MEGGLQVGAICTSASQHGYRFKVQLGPFCVEFAWSGLHTLVLSGYFSFLAQSKDMHVDFISDFNLTVALILSISLLVL